jgi:hypothetical protein
MYQMYQCTKHTYNLVLVRLLAVLPAGTSRKSQMYQVYHSSPKTAFSKLIMSLESLLERLRGEAVTPKPIEDALMGEHEDTDPDPAAFLVALATPAGTCEVLIPKDRYDPLAVLAMVEAWEA